MKGIIYVIVFVLLFVSGLVFAVLWADGYIYPRVYIEQDVEINSVIDNIYSVDSILWIWYKGDCIIEKRFSRYDVLCDSIPTIKQKHLVMLEKEKTKVLERLKDFGVCEHY